MGWPARPRITRAQIFRYVPSSAWNSTHRISSVRKRSCLRRGISKATMSLRVSNLRLSINAPEAALLERLSRVLGVRPGDVSSWRILRKSLDLRDKQAIEFVYAAEVQVPDEERFLSGRHGSVHVERFDEPPFEMPESGEAPLPHRPVVVGSGPGGLAAAYFLAERGYQPLLLERGPPVSERIRDVKAFDEGGEFKPESNYLFGEGGAGTFSDGKLTCRLSGPDV